MFCGHNKYNIYMKLLYGRLTEIVMNLMRKRAFYVKMATMTCRHNFKD